MCCGEDISKLLNKLYDTFGQVNSSRSSGIRISSAKITLSLAKLTYNFEAKIKIKWATIMLRCGEKYNELRQKLGLGLQQSQ